VLERDNQRADVPITLALWRATAATRIGVAAIGASRPRRM
jgi:hypothetical protein